MHVIFQVIHHPRDYPSTFLQSRRGQQLTLIQNMINERLCKGPTLSHLPVDSVTNIERPENALYSLGQLSVHYIQSSLRYNSISSSDHLDNKSTKSSSAFPLALIQREDAMSNSGLDTRSCLQFLQELYGQWLTEDTPLSLLTETVRSMLALSDLFSEPSQFQWMFDHFSNIQKTHPIEDEMLTNLLRIGICKSISVLGLSDPDLLERTRKSLENGIKAANLPTRLGCLHGILYLVQSENPEVTTVMNSHIIPFIMDYLQTYLQHYNIHHVGVCEAHVALMWAMAFYIVENYAENFNSEESESNKEWCENMIQLSISEASKVGQERIYLVILTGLERLVIEQIPDENNTKKLMKMTTDLLTEPNPVIFIPAVQLFLACMYSNKMNATEVGLGQDPEQLMQAMEQMSILFDCVRRSGEVFFILLPSRVNLLNYARNMFSAPL